MKTTQNNLKTKYSLSKYNRILPVFFIAIILVFSSCSSNPHNTDSAGKSTDIKAVSVSDNAMSNRNSKSDINTKTEFSLIYLNGTPYKLSDDLGKKVYIKFWATWCPICLGGIDDLTKFSEEKANDKNIDVITIVSPGVKGEMSTKDFLEWFIKQDYKFKVLIDEGGNVARQYGVRGYPTSAFINTKGEIAKTQVGYLANSDIDNILQSIN